LSSKKQNDVSEKIFSGSSGESAGLRITSIMSPSLSSLTRLLEALLKLQTSSGLPLCQKAEFHQSARFVYNLLNGAEILMTLTLILD
jgi:hypothetical protein